MTTSDKCFTSEHMSQGSYTVTWGGDSSLRLASANDVPRPGPTVFPLQATPAHLQLSQLDVSEDIGVCKGGGQGIIWVFWGSR